MPCPPILKNSNEWVTYGQTSENKQRVRATKILWEPQAATHVTGTTLACHYRRPATAANRNFQEARPRVTVTPNGEEELSPSRLRYHRRARAKREARSHNEQRDRAKKYHVSAHDFGVTNSIHKISVTADHYHAGFCHVLKHSHTSDGNRVTRRTAVLLASSTLERS